MSAKIVINKRLKGLPREELEKLSQKELIDKVIQLQSYNFQLKNILQKKLNDGDGELLAELKNLTTENNVQEAPKAEQLEINVNENANKNANKKRQFDFSKYHTRHVLLKFLYFGWDYQGYAAQEDSNATIENHLFKALTRCCLIQSRNTSNYHRCGRTDKEVSAFCQVISIDLRSKFPSDQQYDEKSLNEEIDYCGLLNRILPKNIQCVAWMPLKKTQYSARFDCTSRTYRYFFPKGDLNIMAMQKACKYLEKHSDFRNFCKMDVHNGVTNYMRNLQKADIEICPNEKDSDDKGYSMYYLQIKANAFLWHQIRCIMAVLILIGQEKEEPEVITELLNVDKNPCKPQYTPAIGLPLNLFHCEYRSKTCRKPNDFAGSTVEETKEEEIHNKYDDEDAELKDSDDADITHWVYNEENLQRLIENVQSEWSQFSIKSTMIRNVLFNLENLLSDNFKPQQIKSQVLLLQDCVKPRQYQKLLNRKRCESLENRIDHFVKKQRLIVTEPAAKEKDQIAEETV